MQRDKVEITVNSYVLTKTKVPNCGEQLRTEQVVAINGDKLTVVPQGSRDAHVVDRAGVQSYQEVYGTSVPVPGARPIVSQIRK